MENQVQVGVAHHHVHHHEHHHEYAQAYQEQVHVHHEHVHHSSRSGHNRITSSQRKRKKIADALFTFLSIIATLMVLFILYDKWKGVF